MLKSVNFSLDKNDILSLIKVRNILNTIIITLQSDDVLEVSGNEYRFDEIDITNQLIKNLMLTDEKPFGIV